MSALSLPASTGTTFKLLNYRITFSAVSMINKIRIISRVKLSGVVCPIPRIPLCTDLHTKEAPNLKRVNSIQSSVYSLRYSIYCLSISQNSSPQSQSSMYPLKSSQSPVEDCTGNGSPQQSLAPKMTQASSFDTSLYFVLTCGSKTPSYTQPKFNLV